MLARFTSRERESKNKVFSKKHAKSIFKKSLASVWSRTYPYYVRQSTRASLKGARMLNLTPEILNAFNNAMHFIALNGYLYPEGYALSEEYLESPFNDLINSLVQKEDDLQHILRHIVMVQEGIFEEWYHTVYKDEYIKTKINAAFFQRRLAKLPEILKYYLEDRADYLRLKS